jgi:ABC-type uncharacterized transport system permease subunit
MDVVTFHAILIPVTLLWSLAFLALLIKKGKVSDAVFAIVAWHIYSLATASGFFEKVDDPHRPILTREVWDSDI